MICPTSQKNSSGNLLAIDEKAIDFVSHTFFLDKDLMAFGFGPIFCKWVSVLYINAQSCCTNGNMSTSYFKLKNE